VVGRKDVVKKIEGTIGVLGGILRPFDAFLLTQGLKTLGLRMERHCASAQKVAEFLESHSKVARVRYGGLPSYEGHQVGKTYLSAFGGMMGVEWKSDATHNSFGSRLKLCKPWVSLGDAVTLVSQRGEESQRAIPKRYTRISIGLEDADDIVADFRQALE
jgi:cystathionine beta-lyase/cystathionine gamma-synthase